MPVYHSTLNEAKGQDACGTRVIAVKTKVRGPAPPARSDDIDIVDETLDTFRANVLFRNYQSEGPADLCMCYLTIYIGEVLRFVQKYKTKAEAQKNITQLSMSGNFSIPGDSGFPLAGFFSAPKNRAEGDLFRGYMRQLREETANRLLDRVYREDGSQNKWWFQFAKRKFMNVAKT